MFKKVMHGKITNEKIKDFMELNTREIILLLLIIVFIFWIGIYPNVFLSKISTGGALKFL